MFDPGRKVKFGAPIAGAGTDLLCFRLSLAATPIFLAMALATGLGGGMAQMPGMETSPLNGMGLMYFLMGVFHAVPWLKLISNRRFPATLQQKEMQS